MGIVVSIILVAFIIVIIVRMRGSSGRDRNNYVHGTATAQGRNNNGLGSLHNSHDMHNGRGNCHVTSSIDSIDKNPDIIPQGEYKLQIKSYLSYATIARGEIFTSYNILSYSQKIFYHVSSLSPSIMVL